MTASVQQDFAAGSAEEDVQEDIMVLIVNRNVNATIEVHVTLSVVSASVDLVTMGQHARYHAQMELTELTVTRRVSARTVESVPETVPADVQLGMKVKIVNLGAHPTLGEYAVPSSVGVKMAPSVTQQLVNASAASDGQV